MSSHQHIVAPAAITTSGNTGALANLGYDLPGIMVVEFNCTAVGGTTPTLTPVIEASPDGTNWFTVPPSPAITAITAVSKQRLVCNPVTEPFVRVSWPAPGGSASPTLTIGFSFNFL